jgi:CDP-archaeol synthase
MNVALVIKILALLATANGTPVVVKRIFGTRADRAIDGGRRLADGQFVFGPSKTIRGFVLSIMVTALIATAMGITLYAGVLIGLGAMASDLGSSFVKRRLRLEPSSKATGLDQIPESLLPCLLVSALVPLTAGDIAVIVVLFFGGEIIFSRVLFWAGIRDHPY